MSGNVWEWTRSLYLHKAYPYKARDGRETIRGAEARVLRGGAFPNISSAMRCASRDGFYPYLKLSYHGFRIVFSPI